MKIKNMEQIAMNIVGLQISSLIDFKKFININKEALTSENKVNTKTIVLQVFKNVFEQKFENIFELNEFINTEISDIFNKKVKELEKSLGDNFIGISNLKLENVANMKISFDLDYLVIDEDELFSLYFREIISKPAEIIIDDKKQELIIMMDKYPYTMDYSNYEFKANIGNIKRKYIRDVHSVIDTIHYFRKILNLK